MAVYHILKDGTVLKDITGHIVKVKDAETLYQYIHNKNKGSRNTQNTYELKR